MQEHTGHSRCGHPSGALRKGYICCTCTLAAEKVEEELVFGDLRLTWSIIFNSFPFLFIFDFWWFVSRTVLPCDVLEPFQLGPNLWDLQSLSRYQLWEQAVEETEILIFRTSQTCGMLRGSTDLLAQRSTVYIHKFLGTGDYRCEDNFTTVQSAGWHSLPNEVLGSIFISCTSCPCACDR